MDFLSLCIIALCSFGALFLVTKFICRSRPVTPKDMNLAMKQELLFTELIMDGRILEGNLKRMGLDRQWLDKQLKQNHIHSPKEVFLTVCNRNLKFVVYKNSSLQ